MTESTVIDRKTWSIGQVLVVDDEPKNRSILRDSLEHDGHTVEEAQCGKEAIDQARENPPDAVLLDVMMPGMDGFAVCRELKGSALNAHVPVIIVTALSERQERLAGIQAGANDFLTKPVDIQDMLLRVRNAVYDKRLFDHLKESHRKLQRLETLRDDLMNMVVHDLRAPLTVLSGYLDVLLSGIREPGSEDGRQCLQLAHDNARQLTKMVTSLLDVSRLEEGRMPLHPEDCDLGSLVEIALEESGATIRNQLRFVNHLHGVRTEIHADPDLVQRVLANLIGNAIRYTPKGGTIEIDAAQTTNRELKVRIEDTGPGIPPEHRQSVFEKFRQVENKRRGSSSGLGLAFCKLAVERHGGKIGVEERPGGGSVFWFTLPRQQADG